MLLFPSYDENVTELGKKEYISEEKKKHKKPESKNTQQNAKGSIFKSLRNRLLNTWFVRQEMIKL